jgi:hypothetical protein
MLRVILDHLQIRLYRLTRHPRRFDNNISANDEYVSVETGLFSRKLFIFVLVVSISFSWAFRLSRFGRGVRAIEIAYNERSSILALSRFDT